jgi:DNA helicase II / ATP-dependent DNA helicase PcrA
VITKELETLTEGLNEDQVRAVTSMSRITAVFAGPGSGKTTVLTRRVGFLLHQGVSPDRMMVVTFTRAAAREMKERLARDLGSRLRAITIGTFHSIFLQMLHRETGRIPVILQENRQREWIRQILQEMDQPADEEAVAGMLSQIGYCKGKGILPDRMRVKKEKNIRFRKVFLAYEERKKEGGFWDYDDILLAFHRVIQEPEHPWRTRFDHVLVDEFQDINPLQFESLLDLVGEEGHLFAVGDDDQAIYGFRGSDPRLMLRLEEVYPDTRKVVLSTNYRSTEEIIDTGQRLIRHNRLRQPKRLKGTGKQGILPRWCEPADEEEEARYILDSLQDGMETAVLYRTATQARAVIDALVRADIDFTVSAGDASFYRRWQVADILAYLRLSENPNDLDALVRVINKPKRYIYGEAWMDELWHLSRKTGKSLLDTLSDLDRLEPYQRKKCARMAVEVRQLQGFSAREAISRIRDRIGYDRFLTSFAEDTGGDAAFYRETVDELELAAEPFANPVAFLRHIEKVEEKVREHPHHPRVRLMTFHKAKGLEFDRVFLIGLHAMVIPHHRSLQVSESKKGEAWEEERRLLYVGITRARKELVLSVSKTRQGKRVSASPFLAELGVNGQEANREKPTSPVPSSGSLLQRPAASDQPQLRFSREAVQAGDRFLHRKWGEGEVIMVEPLGGVAPGRKITVRFSQGVHTLHYELARQLGLLQFPEKKPG